MLRVVKPEPTPVREKPVENVTADDFLNVTGVCALLHVSRPDVYRAVHDGRLPVMRFGAKGRIWRFYKWDVLKLREGRALK